MKKLKRYVTLFFMAVYFSVFMCIPVHAERTVLKHDGLEIVIEMDKELYESGEPVTATITVRNTSTNTITIANLEQLIPEGYRLKGSKAGVQNIELRPAQSTTLKVTFEGDPEQKTTATEGVVDKLIYGETLGIPNLLLTVLLVIAFIIFMILT